MIRKYITILFLGIALAFSAGCLPQSLDPQGVYQGQLGVYNAERTIVTSYALMDNFLKWEYDNRAAFASTPEVKQFADSIRANGRNWITTAIALTEAYKLNPTDSNRDKLEAALNIIDTALMEATKYMVTQPLNE